MMNTQELNKLIEDSTFKNARIEKTYKDFVEDTRKILRMERQRCKVCFYIKNIATNDMCNGVCGICNSSFSYSGSVPGQIFCKDCGKVYSICVVCGAKIDK